MLFEPKLIAIEYPYASRIFICANHFDHYSVVKDFHYSGFKLFDIQQVVHALLGYSHFMGLAQDIKQESLLKQLDKIMIKEKTKCEVKSGKKQVGAKATTKGKS